MSKFQIYLSGGITGLIKVDREEWRRLLCNSLRMECELADIPFNQTIRIFDPTAYYNFEDGNYDSEDEVMRYELNQLRNSNLVVVNFNKPDSIGTAMEVAIAREYRIPILGLNLPIKGEHSYADHSKNIILEPSEYIHPWLLDSVDRFFENVDSLAEYIVNFYLL